MDRLNPLLQSAPQGESLAGRVLEERDLLPGGDSLSRGSMPGAAQARRQF